MSFPSDSASERAMASVLALEESDSSMVPSLARLLALLGAARARVVRRVVVRRRVLGSFILDGRWVWFS